MSTNTELTWGDFLAQGFPKSGHRLTSGPLEGIVCDEQGLWMSGYFRWNPEDDDYDILDPDLGDEFRKSRFNSVEAWINSWDSVEIVG